MSKTIQKPATNGHIADIEVAPKSEEQEAAEKLTEARRRREAACLQEFQALLQRHRCRWEYHTGYVNGQLTRGQLVFVAE